MNTLLSGPTIPRRVQLGFQLHLPIIHGATEPAQADPFLLESELYRLICSHPEQQRDRIEWDGDLQRVARRRCAGMLVRQYYNHVSPEPDSIGPNETLRRAGIRVPTWYDRDAAGNNVESINTNSADAVAIWTSFLASKPHRVHLLGETDFYRGQSLMGIGYARAGEWDAQNEDRLWVMWSILTLHPD